MMSAAQDIEQLEASQPQDAFVTLILAIEPGTFAIVDTGSGQMPDPPERQQEAVQPCAILNETGFQIPAATLGILPA